MYIMVRKLGYEPMIALLRNMVITVWVKIILTAFGFGWVKKDFKIKQPD